MIVTSCPLQLPYPCQASLGRIDRITPSMRYAGAPSVSSPQGCLKQKQPCKQHRIKYNTCYI